MRLDKAKIAHPSQEHVLHYECWRFKPCRHDDSRQFSRICTTDHTIRVLVSSMDRQLSTVIDHANEFATPGVKVAHSFAEFVPNSCRQAAVRRCGVGGGVIRTRDRIDFSQAIAIYALCVACLLEAEWIEASSAL